MTGPRRAPRGGVPPAAGDPSAAARRRRLANRRLIQDARILVWEHADTEPILERLKQLGCSAIRSGSIEEAMALHSAQPFTLLLASPGIEGGTDFAVLQLLRRALPKLPLVLISGEASVTVRIRCQTLRPQYFATPPLEEAELRAILSLAMPQRPGPPNA